MVGEVILGNHPLDIAIEFRLVHRFTPSKVFLLLSYATIRWKVKSGFDLKEGMGPIEVTLRLAVVSLCGESLKICLQHATEPDIVASARI